MARKLNICAGKSCKAAGSDKKLKEWVNELKPGSKIKKSKCLGVCENSFGLKFRGKIYLCFSKAELEKIISDKK
jgi:NADH:ubiquinone oxidoreductase subunit E